MIDSQGNERTTRTMITKEGEKVEVGLRNDTPFSALCDWMEHCESFACKPSVVIDEETSSEKTYTEYSAKWREHQLIQKIKSLFKTKEGVAVVVEKVWLRPFETYRFMLSRLVE